MNRVALVIGNSEYLNIGKLNNPKNDANDIASILGKLNFDVEKVIDANLKIEDMFKSVKTIMLRWEICYRCQRNWNPNILWPDKN